MNIYRHTFTGPCPNNGMAVTYRLEIRTTWVIMVEDIVQACIDAQTAERPYHETIADNLYVKFGGEQIMVGFHHGCEIETRRGG